METERERLLGKMAQINAHLSRPSSFCFDFQSRTICISVQQQIEQDQRCMPAAIRFDGVSSFASNDVDIGNCVFEAMGVIDCRTDGKKHYATLAFSPGDGMEPWVVTFRFTDVRFERNSIDAQQ